VRERSQWQHRAATTWAGIERDSGELSIALAIVGLAIVGRWRRRRRRRGEKLSAACKLGAAVAIGQEAVMADTMEAVRQGMQEETADELAGGKGITLGLSWCR
jgi:hypothetical protein